MQVRFFENLFVSVSIKDFGKELKIYTNKILKLAIMPLDGADFLVKIRQLISSLPDFTT